MGSGEQDYNRAWLNIFPTSARLWLVSLSLQGLLFIISWVPGLITVSQLFGR